MIKPQHRVPDYDEAVDIVSGRDRQHVVNTFGNPPRFETLEDSEYLYYSGFTVVLRTEMSRIDYISIHTISLTLEDVLITENDPDEAVLQKIKNLHRSRNCPLKMSAKTVFEEHYVCFQNIGLSVWFGDGRLTDICVEKPAVVRPIP